MKRIVTVPYKADKNGRILYPPGKWGETAIIGDTETGAEIIGEYSGEDDLPLYLGEWPIPVPVVPVYENRFTSSVLMSSRMVLDTEFDAFLASENADIQRMQRRFAYRDEVIAADNPEYIGFIALARELGILATDERADELLKGLRVDV